MSKPLTILISVFVLVGVVVVLFAFVPCENYNYICPSIDTKYASRFSESAFSLVATGMQSSAVTQMLGLPLHVVQHRDGTETWRYTSDGKCSWGDFAWLARDITFRDGGVIFVERRVYYD